MEQLMRAHFKEAGLIRAAVIAGNPLEAVKSAEALRTMDNVDKLPEAWRTYVERMQTAAARVKDSNDVAQAAAATADIGTSCGLCHQKFGGPAANIKGKPEAGTTVASRMATHAWATERLWEGLFVPSDAAWKEGAAALKTDPFPDEVLKKGGVYARTAAKDFVKVVAKAPSQKTSEARAEVYAQLLETCGACHIAVNKSE